MTYICNNVPCLQVDCYSAPKLYALNADPLLNPFLPKPVPVDEYGKPLPAPVHHAPVHHAPVYKEEPHPYSYKYGVHDEYSGANFNADETADGHGNVIGSYR